MRARRQADAEVVGKFVGSWTAVGVEVFAEDGSRVHPLGPRPNGFVTYDAAGNVSALFADPEVARFAAEDPYAGSHDEIRRAYHGFLGYFGTYRVDAARGTVTHHYVASSFPNDRGRAAARRFEFVADTLILRTVPEPLGGLVSAVVTLRRAR